MSFRRSGQSDSRKRQSKKDDAIRRKIEHELSKKRGSGSRVNRSKKGAPGTVWSLMPSDPIVCKASITVYEAAQLMSAKRENCILVVDDVGGLIGIFTAKDLAFRIVGQGLNANNTPIEQIMTRDPICTQASSPASDALTLMVEKGFRHLPVLDDENHIVGVLDITKSYAQQMEKLERLHASSKQLYDALDSVNTEMGGMGDQPRQVFEYFQDLKQKMDGPTLESVLDHSTHTVYTTVKSSVYEATILMRENRTTAVLVKDTNDTVSGIFTSKDVVLRVIAAGLDPKKCSVVRVMTPQPDFANSKLSIQQALRQMFEGHYLNLPIVDDENEIVGIVDVLRLTYATLNQIKRIENSEKEETGASEGPAWNKFWTSLDNNDSESIHSDSAVSAPDVTPSEFQSFNIDVNPSDSISAVEETSSKQMSKTASVAAREGLFVFKFRSPALQSRVHRVTVRPEQSLQELKDVIDSKIHKKDLEAMNLADGENYAISYVDDEGDIVSITSDHDLRDCVEVHEKFNITKADIYLHHPHDEAPVGKVKPLKAVSTGDLIPGVSNQTLIPGVLAAATAIAAVFYVTKK
ncbi:hypothetical protein FT663_00869 [Candidozyma haemuli var. vulneris]|uniref:CBS domain-containing protein n=1 Tax=Candidozyma haemuli TaxID=45357 RepID=A0A2V1AV25_9ASCO|nr:hypothetical protein CXQ85_004635 [[Candida] haemuloni]KAF3990933.1 hypothetical protein FT662_01990 [[Candida] haemuloni var. vulneris]KAF3995033.1 hypothetical protein FT663_00869 [[Candida] haemuloni var. vulneris]PVH21970.1 hypothetical protein CXQ85_004635 [[Candida] haemuloni]